MIPAFPLLTSIPLLILSPGISNSPPLSLLIASQIPGYIHSGDVSSVVTSTTAWPSFNVPYYADIWNVSGWRDAWVQSNYSDTFLHGQFCPTQHIKHTYQ